MAAHRFSHRARVSGSRLAVCAVCGGRGFTLIETLVAVSLLSVAIVAPMLLAVQSLTAAYYARDQMTAGYLAQEALEAVRQIRDDNILQLAESADPGGITLFDGIPFNNCSGSPKYFVVDARKVQKDDVIPSKCEGGADSCPPLETDGTLYGYEPGNSNWHNTQFVRAVSACVIDPQKDEMRVTVTVNWQTGNFPARSLTISEDLFRWVQDSSAAT